MFHLKKYKGFTPHITELCGRFTAICKKLHTCSMRHKKKLCGGFTLIELMVALGIFSVIMAVTTGGFIRVLKTQRQSADFAFVNNTLSVALEQMSKEIRTGKNFTVNGAPCPPNSSLSFVNAKGKNVIYFLDNKVVRRSENTAMDCSQGDEITGSKVSVEYLIFIIRPDPSGSYPQRITILMGATPSDESTSLYKVNLQTTVSSRRLGA